ncbi:MAG: acyltransferase [Desulfomicrobium sp.]|nr:acyltransferase [Desulfomicrobium sp.]
MIFFLDKLRLHFAAIRAERMRYRLHRLFARIRKPRFDEMTWLARAFLTRIHNATAWMGVHNSGTQRHAFCIFKSTTRIYPSAVINNNVGSLKAITLGEHTYLRGELFTFGHGGEIHVGDYCYIGEGTRIWSAASILIGDRVLISHNVNIFDNDTHPIEDAAARHRQFVDIITTGHPRKINLNEAPVIIEDDVLIACQSIILSGVRIGRGAVVAAGSVVTRDVPPFTIVAGNPARVIRTLENAS